VSLCYRSLAPPMGGIGGRRMFMTVLIILIQTVVMTAGDLLLAKGM